MAEKRIEGRGRDIWPCYKAAFAAARGGDEITDALIEHLKSMNPEIRAAAAAALREAGDPRALRPLRVLANDVDPSVVQQATTSIRFLETPELIEIARSKKIHPRGDSSQ
jgi:HEAT repeat protein